MNLSSLIDLLRLTHFLPLSLPLLQFLRKSSPMSNFPSPSSTRFPNLKSLPNPLPSCLLFLHFLLLLLPRLLLPPTTSIQKVSNPTISLRILPPLRRRIPIQTTTLTQGA